MADEFLVGGLLGEGIFGLMEEKPIRKVARARAKLAKAREARLAFQIPFIPIAAEESLARRGVQDSSIAPTVRQEAALRVDELLKQIALSRQQRKAAKRLRRLGIAKRVASLLGTALGAATAGVSEGTDAGRLEATSPTGGTTFRFGSYF